VYNKLFCLFVFWYGVVSNLGEPTFREVGPLSLAHLIEKNELHLFAGILGPAHIEVCAHRKDPLPDILTSSSEVFWKTSLYVYKGSSSRHVIVIAVKEVRVFRVTI